MLLFERDWIQGLNATPVLCTRRKESLHGCNFNTTKTADLESSLQGHGTTSSNDQHCSPSTLEVQSELVRPKYDFNASYTVNPIAVLGTTFI
jgi:hypothetical protein